MGLRIAHCYVCTTMNVQCTTGFDLRFLGQFFSNGYVRCLIFACLTTSNLPIICLCYFFICFFLPFACDLLIDYYFVPMHKVLSLIEGNYVNVALDCGPIDRKYNYQYCISCVIMPSSKRSKILKTLPYVHMCV